MGENAGPMLSGRTNECMYEMNERWKNECIGLNWFEMIRAEITWNEAIWHEMAWVELTWIKFNWYELKRHERTEKARKTINEWTEQNDREKLRQNCVN